MRYHSRHILHNLFHGFDLFRRIVLGIIFYGVILVVVVLIISNRPPKPKDGSLLVLNPYGTLVESYTMPSNYQGIPLGGFQNESLLSNLVKAVDLAGSDDKIDALWLRLDDFFGGGPAAISELSEALVRFQGSGKPVYASSDSFDNDRYQLAAPADLIAVDRLGEVFPTGYGYWRAYYSEGLERLGAEVNLFRSGESKSAAENFIRDGISDIARENEQRLLDDLWSSWLQNVSISREIEIPELVDWIDNYDIALTQTGGNAAQAALDAGLVDLVETGNNFEERIGIQYLQPVDKRIDAMDYLAAYRERRSGPETVAVVPIVGTLVYGESRPGSAGSDNVVASINAARNAPGVRAIVIRIDSGGGDVRAGEAIRRALEETRGDYEIPVVASLGNLAASGGYWIALESDLIITRAETITGSIGVFSLSLSFEQALEKWLGIRIDGTGTTRWSGALHPGLSIDERTASIYESTIGDIDTMFRNLVADRRELSREIVDNLAGGIPWSGKRAITLGLADREGGVIDAGEAAAELAGLDQWTTRYFEDPVNIPTQLFGRLLWGKQKQMARVN